MNDKKIDVLAALDVLVSHLAISDAYSAQVLPQAGAARAAVAELIEREARLQSALIAFAEHFGPLEDNDMLNDDVRRCFSLARAALARIGGA